MRQMPCPNNDQGRCTIPDPALVISEQGISLVRADVASRLLPVVPQPDELRPLDLPMSYEHLVGEVQSSLLGETVPPLPGPALLRATALETAGHSVVVNCSCGHRYVADLPLTR